MRKFRSSFDSHYLLTTEHGSVVFNDFIAEADGKLADDLAKSSGIVEITPKPAPSAAAAAPKPAVKK